MECVGADRPVLLIGFQNQPNLGIGYLAASLRARGLTVRIIDFEAGTTTIVDAALEENPILIGLSLIFQFYLSRFARLVATLRERGIMSHITVGGHFPSLCPAETLAALPGIDSVTRFEGELTLVELVESVTRGNDWRDVRGIAYLDGDGRPISNPPRPLVADLDTLPAPVREGPGHRVMGVDAVPLLASRGCARNCTFCSIRQFYRGAPGRPVRVRDPGHVADEMRALLNERGTRLFLFQDDDFPVWGSYGRRWSSRFIEALRDRELVGSVLWKISCRVDEVEPELFASLRDAGLYLVYLGIESGTDEGLAALGKRTTAATCFKAVRTLNRLGLLSQYGFMLLDPSSTFASVHANLAFLRRVVSDGRRAVSFCRMLPYGGTEVQEQLLAAGRMRGTIEEPDYAFFDPRLHDLVARLESMVAPWFGQDGLSFQLNGAWQEVAVVKRLFPPLPCQTSYENALVDLTRRANEGFLGAIEEISTAVESGRDSPQPSRVVTESRAIASELLDRRTSLVLSNKGLLLATLEKLMEDKHTTSPLS